MAILELDPHGQHNHPMVLEDNTDVTHLGLWVGLYPDGEEDLMLVLQCSRGLYSLLHALTSLHLASLVKYFTIGTHSCCLSEWESLSKIRLVIFLHKVKIIHTTRGQTK